MSLARRSPSRTAGVLILVCVGLLALILLELDQAPLSRVARSTPSAAPERAPVVDLEAKDLEFEMPALSRYSDIEARPLFSPTRRPPPPEETRVVEEEEPAPVSRDLVLRGVATAGKDRVALIEERASGELVRAGEGQSVGGWRLVSIGQRAVELEGRGGKLVLEVEPDSSEHTAAERQRRPQRDAPRPDDGPKAVDGERPADDPQQPEVIRD